MIETAIYLNTEARRLAREQSQRLGITATQASVLKLLEEIGDLSLSELSRRIAARNSTVTGIVDRMEQAGLVAREQSSDDRRVWRIRLTDKGHGLARRLDVAPWGILRRAIEALPDRDRDALVGILQKVAAKVAELVEEGEKNGVGR